MAYIPWGKPRGAVHDLARALDYGEGGTNVLVVSDACLYAIQNLAAHDLAFPSRWADEILENGYVPISEQSENYGAWLDLIGRIQSEILAMSEIDVHPYGFTPVGWVEAALPFGFHAVVRDFQTETLAAGSNTKLLYTAAAGYITVVQAAFFVLTGTPPTFINLVLNDGDVYSLAFQPSPASGTRYVYNGLDAVLIPGDQIELRVSGATLNDTVQVGLRGYRFIGF